jgi:hypothetical protein
MARPSDPLPLLQGTRPLKRWRYVGVFAERVMLCAASVQVGPARQTFWGVYVRAGGVPDAGRMFERTRLIPRGGMLDLTPGRLRIRDDGVLLELTLEEEGGIEARCPNGDSYVWTRKQAGVRAHGTLTLAAHPTVEIDGRAVIDDTAGYHARVTEWWWAAGVGAGADGTPLAFNLVQGVNDPPSGSERAIWVAGMPHEAPPVSFSADLSTIDCEDGSRLHFAAEAERSRRENLLIVRSDYRAPFGTFNGTLPGGIELARGLGVVEHHQARW